MFNVRTESFFLGSFLGSHGSFNQTSDSRWLSHLPLHLMGKQQTF